MSESITRELDMAARGVRRMLDNRLRDLGLYVGQDALILFLQAEGPVSCGAAIESLQLRPPTISKMTRRLERHGYLTRRQNPEDNRVVLLDLTAKGRDIAASIKAIHAEIEEVLVSAVYDSRRLIADLNHLRTMDCAQ